MRNVYHESPHICFHNASYTFVSLFIFENGYYLLIVKIQGHVIFIFYAIYYLFKVFIKLCFLKFYWALRNIRVYLFFAMLSPTTVLFYFPYISRMTNAVWAKCNVPSRLLEKQTKETRSIQQ